MRYQKPGSFTQRVFNPIVAFLVRRGVNVAGSRVLVVRGRKSGQLRSTPVNLLVMDGERYLVAPRGHTEWVRNLRVAGEGELRLGKKAEPFTATELPDPAKVDVLRAYLKRWAWEVGVFFDKVDADSPTAELLRVAPDHPVFRLS
ncbi:MULTISPECIES: nitroreductase family deazaflavin-dependent oxidoreductase [Actinokineospora]|uniref:Nitroreductase n=1 Tax=Actinokineospora fastidiosa TaxID=1816 RepID=A0A918LI99_9PSEU|nr:MULTISPECIES: nitroreductase family deazaflavin-dependent oxidoreductase [Actinokineospora]UVS77995.1 deazaflavin-dependent oxidoreductase, nitroreductase family [Actinokineospora sp. UTMC 2448]GGS50523.1 nitroreductase [Actinokineospora fastidiosa]